MILDQNFGHKELYEVTLRAKAPMYFGERYIEADEPVLYFNNVNMSLLTESNRPVFARGGWANMPRIIWDERGEVQFQMTEGVMSSVGMSILLGANVLSQKERQPMYVHMIESILAENTISQEIKGKIKEFPYVELQHKPVNYPIKKVFIFDYDRDTIQNKIYGKDISVVDANDSDHWRIMLAKDKNFEEPVENNRKYTIDYYYKYEHEALIYSVQKERFNGLFALEAKFYSKDENEGLNYTNILYMPKVRVVSNINLRLGERADPTVSTFNIIGLPETVGDQKNLIMEITRLGEPDDGDI